MKTASLVLLVLGLTATLAGIVIAVGFATAFKGATLPIWIAGIGLLALGFLLRNLNRTATPLMRSGATVVKTTRRERIVAKQVNGEWSIDFSGDPLIAKDPALQSQVLDALRQSGKLSDDAYAAIKTKLEQNTPS